MAITSNNKKGQDGKKYKVINLKYEYEGYGGNEKWAIISELSEKELYGLYPDEMRRYSPFLLLSVEQGKAIADFKLNEDKYRKRSINNEDYFGYSEGLTENLHTEAIVSDFVEQQENEEYCKMREELKQRLFDQAIASLTEKQRRHLLLRYVEGKTSVEIAREEGISEQAVRKNTQTAIRKFEKIFGDFFRK
jgi:RNA polymerase sigma factor, sigma-70 family